MLVIPMWQPHASAVAVGMKKVETRSRPIKYRGLVAIHAAKKYDGEIIGIIDALPPAIRYELRDRQLHHWGYTYPRGQIVAVGRLIDCRTTSVPPHAIGWSRPVFGAHPEIDTLLERALGNYEPGRYGWVLDNIRPLRIPLRYKAHQGCYQLAPDVEAELRGRELI